MRPKNMLKQTPFLILLTVMLGFAAFLCGTVNAQDPKAEPSNALEDILFERVNGKERITFVLSKLTGYNVARESAETLALKLENIAVPPDKARKLDEVSLKVVNRITVAQETVDGRLWAYFKINMKEMVPYVVKDEGRKVFVDFDVAALAESKTPPAAAEKKELKVAAPAKTAPQYGAVIRQYTGQKLTVDFQDANLKNVFRLIAEASGLNIVAGEDVKGSVTMQLKEVPWDQALETILDAYSLGQKRVGNVITVLPADKVKKAEEQRLKEAVSRGRLKQVSIEAKIVEANTTFIRKIGVQWGAGALGTWDKSTIGALGGSAGYAPSASPNTINTYLPTPPYPIGTGVGVTQSNLAVNFPTIFSGVPNVGIIAGSSKYIVDVNLHALESNNEGKIISSPKVATLDNVKATIKQGEEVPYVIESVSGGVVTRTVQFKEAVLKLDVKPSITPEGKISMEIKATNDFADYTRSVLGNPPINKSEVDSTIVVKDGDTIVVGGIQKVDESKTTAGIPWVMKIPILGWLFKAEDIQNKKKEILIFITPKIIQEAA